MEMNDNVLRYKANDDLVSEVISIGGCSDMTACTIANVQPSAQGRIVEIGVRVRRVCPGKRTALGILLHELDENDVEYVRGMKSMTLPAHSESSCRDIVVEGIRFVLPEDVSLAESCASGGCGERRFRVRTHVHYVDINVSCD